MASSSSAQQQMLQPQSSEPAGQQSYRFPTYRLRDLEDIEKKPLVLVVCGSFSPITIMHLRMCEMASDWVHFFESHDEVVGMYFSPVSDAYRKTGLASARHRIAMCELAVQDTPNCLMVDPWEASQPDYVPTARVLDHFRHEINVVRGGIPGPDGIRREARVALLAGADLLNTMSTPGVWSDDDLQEILGRGGIYVIERHGTDVEEAKSSLSQYTDHIQIIPQGIPIDLSSTKVRLYLKKKMSVRYFVPNKVIDYIHEYGLYQPDPPQPSDCCPASTSR